MTIAPLEAKRSAGLFVSETDEVIAALGTGNRAAQRDCKRSKMDPNGLPNGI